MRKKNEATISITSVLVLILYVSLFLSGCNLVNTSISQLDIKTPISVETNLISPTEDQELENTPIPSLSTYSTLTPTLQVPFIPLSFSASSCDYGGVFHTIEALDEYSVRFVLCKREVAFLSKIAFPPFSIYPREWLEENSGEGAEGPLLEKPIGTGPYRIISWEHGDKLVLESYKAYWGDQNAKMPNLIFRWDLDATKRLLEMQAGTVDGIDSINSIDFPTVLNDSNLVLIPRPPLSISYLGMNNLHPPFDNELVRLAIALAIDRDKIVGIAFPMGYEVASHFTPCIIPHGCIGESWYEFDPEQARELLDEAGYPTGFQTELAYRDVVRGFLPWPYSVAEELKEQLWQNLKIDIKIRKMEEVEFYNSVDNGSLSGMHMLGWGADYPDVSNFLDTHFGKGATGQFGSKFQDIVDLLDKGNGTADIENRHLFYEAANNAIKLHVPMVPIAHGGWITPDSLAVVYKGIVDGAHASPVGLEEFSVMSIPGHKTLVWMQSAEPLSLYCADQTDIESFRVCAQINEGLYRFSVGSAAVEPALAKSCQADEDLQIWTCTLRRDVYFHDGSRLDANDVVMSYVVQWDAASPLRIGNSRAFLYFKEFWGEFLNNPIP